MTALETIQALVKALEAGNYNAAPSTLTNQGVAAPEVDNADYPHKCPRCKGPAYIGLSKVDCKAKC